MSHGVLGIYSMSVVVKLASAVSNVLLRLSCCVWVSLGTPS